MGIVLPSPLNLLRLTVMPARGLFAISPVLILAIPGYVYLWRKRELRREWWLLLVVPVVFLLWNSGYFGWHSGWMYGSRYLVAMLPFLVLSLGFTPWCRGASWSLLGFSAALMLVAVAGCHYPEEGILNPISELMWPLMEYGYRSASAGQLLGLSWRLSLVAFVLVLLAGCSYLDRRVEPEVPEDPKKPSETTIASTSIAVAWGGMVLLLLVLVHTPNTGHVHRVRARILEDYAYATNQPLLLPDVQRERQAWKAYGD